MFRHIFTSLILSFLTSIMLPTFTVTDDPNITRMFSGIEDLDQFFVHEIIPGGDMRYREAPFLVAVFNALFKYQTCTGIIFRKDAVFCGGYCVFKNGEVAPPEYVSVLSGVFDFRDRQMDQWRYALNIRIFPHIYITYPILVVIRLNEPFFLNTNCRVPNLTPIRSTIGLSCRVISWRFHDILNRLVLKSLVLKKYSVDILNQTECSVEFKYNPILTNLGDMKYVCAVFNIRQKDPDFDCMGSDGSCLVCQENRQSPRPIGIAVTYRGSSKCNRNILPSVFLDIRAYIDWIKGKQNSTQQKISN